MALHRRRGRSRVGGNLMSFSTDLAAVRERAGLPVVYRIRCGRHGKPESLITVDPERANAFIKQHAIELARENERVTYLEGPGRFRIKRFPLGSSTDPVWPWRVTDAERPGVFGRARTHAAAVELVSVMHSSPGQAAQVLDDDDEVVAHITGTGWPSFYSAASQAARALAKVTALPPILKPEPGSIIDLMRSSSVPLIEVPPCNCGSVDKYGDDLDEHSSTCGYHVAALALTEMGVDDEHLNAILKRARRA